MDTFESAAGSVSGTKHAAAGRNNQDAWHVVRNERATIAIVCDGCSSGTSSEVGAHCGARLVAESLCRAVALHGPDVPAATLLEYVRKDVLSALSGLLRRMGERTPAIIEQYFLFTIVGVAILSSRTFIFALGDGIVAVNGEVINLGSFPNNEPPYIVYGIVETSLKKTSPELLRFRIVHELPTEAVQSILIGTDGVRDLIARADRLMPGRDEIVGPLSQFWTEDRYFRNRDMVRRRLFLLNRTTTSIDWQTQSVSKADGLLEDDTTLVVLRRRKD